jgi:hypothetical protein
MGLPERVKGDARAVFSTGQVLTVLNGVEGGADEDDQTAMARSLMDRSRWG